MTAKAFREGTEAYFDSISRRVPVMIRKPMLTEDGLEQLDEYGHLLYRWEQAENMAGEKAWKVEWLEKPSITGLCLYLGIDKATFCRWAAPDPAVKGAQSFCDTATRARGRCELYLQNRLEDGKAANGAKFDLSHNFGWTEKKQVSLDEDTRKAVSRQPMTMDEKLDALRELDTEEGRELLQSLLSGDGG